MATTKRTAKRTANGNGGGKWCRPTRRLALYLRDGLACVWCGLAVEDGAVLTLDHVVSRSAGGSHQSSNLVTCCRSCNSARQDRLATSWAADVATYLGVDRDAVVSRLRNALRRKLPLVEARELIARRGTAARAVAEIVNVPR